MKAKFTTLTLVALLGVSGTTTALAHEDYSEGAMYHNLQHLTKDTQAKGAQGRPGERASAPLMGYGEGDMYDNLRQLTKDAPSKGAQGRPGERTTAPLMGYGEGDMYDNLRQLTKDAQ